MAVYRAISVLVTILASQLLLIHDAESYVTKISIPSKLRSNLVGYRQAQHQQQNRLSLLSLSSTSSSSSSSSSSSANGDFVDDLASSYETISENEIKEKDKYKQHQVRNRLKFDMLQLGASYDRGFGATSRAVDEAKTVIDKLEAVNPETNASKGIDGDQPSSSPLEGSWRMVWTTASDVLVLGANPFLTVGAIYQVFDPPVVTNVIDLLPRIQNLFPIPNLGRRPDSVLRAEVTTRASSRPNKPMRVGLVFERVKLAPIEFLGNTGIADLLPSLAFDLPRVSSPELVQAVSSFASAFSSSSTTTSSSSQATGDNDIGFFDVTYLDDDLLIIRQNAPGGLFVLTKVDNNDP
jgi:PAP_fibrillin